MLYRDATGTRESGRELHHMVKLKTPKLVVTTLGPMTDNQEARLYRSMESYVEGLARKDFVHRRASSAPVANTLASAKPVPERRAMAELCHNRLTVLGSKAQVLRFLESNWDRSLRARHCELLENSPPRYACQFETERPPLESLRRLSRHWPRVTFLLVYELEAKRIIGLARAKAGHLEHWEITY